MKHIICYSGGLSSALVASMVIDKYGKDNVILLNHVVGAEPDDVTRFEQEVAKYHGIDITYANADTSLYPTLSPIEVAKVRGGFAFRQLAMPAILCTTILKTEPFYKWLKENYVEGDIIYYGFDKNEEHRITRRSSKLAKDGYKMDAPLFTWKDPYTKEYLIEKGIKLPKQYSVFKHANCIGCHKASRLHWLCVFIHKREVFDKHSKLEIELGHSIMKDATLEELQPMFEKVVKIHDLEINEYREPMGFWAEVRQHLKYKPGPLLKFFDLLEKEDYTAKPCECLI